ncbi:DUF982 domain-containing protein [Rhizobium binae]|uniref:DUF982 domain-containing protein n=1 Tax=Rhizobium binae TaxID=1138190 RepID=UPI001C83874D|nr:DUF982 domain-containing protein [Rhizobium binae]MBX4937087.1 DUF982 domain-containing protein [Rhizobium binae]MBX4943899.1 DUF982 domain-containing protein [Rhizobium binae]MBX4963126.1 DUF982 domain-containing protein [Rhizobium binae]MBX4979582.1 DUF982 domain-containing protein [Rhizobium binae]
MKPDVFKKPVTIFVGLGFPAEVRTVMEAYRHLSEWPVTLRDAAHSIALKACTAALRCEIEAETARGLFVAFADRHDLLAPESATLITSLPQRNKEPHVP